MILKLLVWIGIPLILYFLFGKKTIFIIMGTVLGIYFVRNFAFDMTEVVGWELFWDSVKKGHINQNDIKEIILKSTTFHKSFLGGVIGGVIGNSLGSLIFGKK